MSQADEVSRSIGFGEAAIAQIRRNVMPAYPRNYELWYTYSAGYNHALNRAVNGILRERGRIGEDEVERIYNQHLSPSRLGDQLEAVSNRIT